MELFLENGHLSDEGLSALCGGTLNELSRLEAAEHLSFCDDCLSHQLAVLAFEPAAMLAPQAGFEKRVMARAGQKGRAIALRRYAPAAAAVCLVAGMWVAGFFLPASTGGLYSAPHQTTASAVASYNREVTPLSDTLNGMAMKISGAFNSFFLSLRTQPPA